MLSVVRASARCLGCCQATQTWSRRLYQRLQCRQYHQSAWLACSPQDPKLAQEPLAAEASDSKRSSRKQFNSKKLYTVRKFTKQEIEKQDWRTDWDKGLPKEDTFGSLDGEKSHPFRTAESRENFKTSRKQGPKHLNEREKVPQEDSLSEKSKPKSRRHSSNDRRNKNTFLDAEDTFGSFPESNSKDRKPYADKGFIATNIYEVNSRGNKNRVLDAEDTLGSFSESHRKERKPSPEKGKNSENIEPPKKQEANYKDKREKVPRKKKSVSEKSKRQSDRHNSTERRNKNRTHDAEDKLRSFSESHSKEGEPSAEKGQNSENFETSQKQEPNLKDEREKVPRKKKSVSEKTKHQSDRHYSDDKRNNKRTLDAEDKLRSFSESHRKKGEPSAEKGQNSENIETPKKQEANHKDKREKVPRKKKSVSEKSKHQSDGHYSTDRRNKNRTLDAEVTLRSFSESHRKKGEPSAEKGQNSENFETSQKQEPNLKDEREKVPRKKKSVSEKTKHQSDRHYSDDKRNNKRTLDAEDKLRSFSESHRKKGEPSAEKGQNSENIETFQKQEPNLKEKRKKVSRKKKSVSEKSEHPRDRHYSTDRRNKNRTLDAEDKLSFSESHSKEGTLSAEKDLYSKGFKERPERRRYQPPNKGQTERREARPEKPASAESQQWSDQFGLMSTLGDDASSGLHTDDKAEVELLHEEMVVKPHIPLGTYNRRHTANWYARRIIKLGEQGQVKDAIQVFDQWMLVEDRVKPTVFEFTVLIDLLGRVGYTKKAFKLYNQMLRMGITEEYSPHLYTCLFNACANSPWPDDGLKRAVYLRTRLLVKQTKPNRIIYNAMIRAFGMCGDINTAFSIADETAHFFKPDSNLLASLLSACISDKESGFRHAIMVWRKMKKMGVKPELKDYNLLLRAVNECGIGSPELAEDILIDKDAPQASLAAAGSSDNTKTRKKRTDKMTSLQNQRMRLYDKLDSALSKYINVDEKAGKAKVVEEIDLDCIDTPVESNGTANVNSREMLDKTAGGMEASENMEWWQMDVFISKDTDKHSLPATADYKHRGKSVLDPMSFQKGIPLSNIKTPQDRLAILGGYEKILHTLDDNGMAPDRQLYTQLMKGLPSVLEDNLLDEMDMANCQPDIVFCNLLIEKRAKRKDFKGTQRVLKLMEENDLIPNIMTYGCMAITYTNIRDAIHLFNTMEEAGMEPNVQIMTTLVSGSYFDFKYKKFLLAKMEKIGISPNKRTLIMVEKHISKARLYMAYKEKNPSDFNVRQFASQLDDFLHFYRKWCKRSKMAKEDHPWAPFWSPKEPSQSPDQATIED